LAPAEGRQNVGWPFDAQCPAPRHHSAHFSAHDTGDVSRADKHVPGAISHNHLAISQHISDVGLYSTMATTGVL
jgi:hypothetical protein